MKTQTKFPNSMSVLVPEATAQVQTLGQQQITAALFALGNSNRPAEDGRSQPLPVGAARNRCVAAAHGLGDRCPYCGSARYAIRRGRLANLHSEAGRCPTCGTRGWSYRD